MNTSTPDNDSELEFREERDPLLLELADHPDPRVQLLFERYNKLTRRMNRIVSISDNYQAELRETTQNMEKMARTDPLTELANRRAMVDHMERELARAVRQGSGFSLVLFDIDNFKRINDLHGHAIGDQALVEVSRTLTSLLRRSDVCARWGGEEFLILCPQTEQADARAVAEKCREGVAKLLLQTVTGEVRVTLSGGVASSRVPAESWEIMVSRADTALYRAKEAGKNRIVLS